MKKIIFLSGVVLIVAGVLFIVFQPVPKYDIQQVHPRLRILQQPFQSVKAFFFWDGGSIGIEIVDRDGRREEFAIPSHLGENDHYTKVFVGAIYDQKSGAVEIAQPEQTKRMLICILRDYRAR